MGTWQALNAALSNGWDMWNKLSTVRQADAQSRATKNVKDLKSAANTDVENYANAAQEQKQWANSDMGKLATAFGVDQYDQKRMDDFKADAQKQGWLGQDGRVNFDAVKTYLGNGGGGANDWQSQVSSALDNRDKTAQERGAAIDKDLVNSTKQRFNRLGDDAIDAMHEYNVNWDQEALKNEDKYGADIAEQGLSRALNSDNPEVRRMLVQYHNLGNPNARLIENQDGTYNVVDANGQVLQKNFTPTDDQLNAAKAQFINGYRFFRTGNFKDFAEGRKELAQGDLATSQARKAGVEASVAEKYADKKANAETQSAELDTKKKDIESKYWEVNASETAKQLRLTNESLLKDIQKKAIDNNWAPKRYAAEIQKALASAANDRSMVGLHHAQAGLVNAQRKKTEGELSNNAPGLKFVADPEHPGAQIAVNAVTDQNLFRQYADGSFGPLGDPDGAIGRSEFDRLGRSSEFTPKGQRYNPKTRSREYRMQYTDSMGKYHDDWFPADELPAVFQELSAQKGGGKKGTAKGRGSAIPVSSEDFYYGYE